MVVLILCPSQLQCIKNLEKVLIHAGASLENVVKVNSE